MGLTETKERPQLVPRAELVEHVKEGLAEDFTSLLTLGGLVTSTGAELTQPLDTVADILSPELEGQIESQRVLKLNRIQIKIPLNELVDLSHFNRTSLYLFAPSAIDGLAYRQSRGGSIMPWFVNKDGSTITPHTDAHHFAQFFSARTRQVLKHENIGGSYFRFAAEILKDISNDKGLGSIDGKKAQDFIRDHKTS